MSFTSAAFSLLAETKTNYPSRLLSLSVANFRSGLLFWTLTLGPLIRKNKTCSMKQEISEEVVQVIARSVFI